MDIQRGWQSLSRKLTKTFRREDKTTELESPIPTSTNTELENSGLTLKAGIMRPAGRCRPSSRPPTPPSKDAPFQHQPVATVAPKAQPFTPITLDTELISLHEAQRRRGSSRPRGQLPVQRLSARKQKRSNASSHPPLPLQDRPLLRPSASPAMLPPSSSALPPAQLDWTELVDETLSQEPSIQALPVLKVPQWPPAGADVESISKLRALAAVVRGPGVNTHTPNPHRKEPKQDSMFDSQPRDDWSGHDGSRVSPIPFSLYPKDREEHTPSPPYSESTISISDLENGNLDVEVPSLILLNHSRSCRTPSKPSKASHEENERIKTWPVSSDDELWWETEAKRLPDGSDQASLSSWSSADEMRETEDMFSAFPTPPKLTKGATKRNGQCETLDMPLVPVPLALSPRHSRYGTDLRRSKYLSKLPLPLQESEWPEMWVPPPPSDASSMYEERDYEEYDVDWHEQNLKAELELLKALKPHLPDEDGEKKQRKRKSWITDPRVGVGFYSTLRRTKTMR